MDIRKVTYPRYKLDCATKLFEIPPQLFILEGTEYLKKLFVEIKGNIKHDLTGTTDERGTGNSNYHLDKIIEAITRSSKMTQTLLQGETLKQALIMVILMMIMEPKKHMTRLMEDKMLIFLTRIKLRKLYQ